MKRRMRTDEIADVLRYRDGNRQDSRTLRRAYEAWRAEQGLPLRCDEPTCRFFTEPLVWNGKKLPVSIDHKTGCNSDDTPGNLRFLCGNCETQQAKTRGGANKGRITKYSGGYGMSRDDGEMDHLMPCEPIRVRITGGAVTFRVR